MTRIFISVGSNIEREKYSRIAIDELVLLFDEVVISSIYESEAVGFSGPSYYNFVVGASTDLSLDMLVSTLKQLEFKHGRAVDAKKNAPRTLDLDLLLYDTLVTDTPAELPRKELLTRAFVLEPMAEIAADVVHPLTSETMQTHWQQFDAPEQVQHVVNFRWNQRDLPCHIE